MKNSMVCIMCTPKIISSFAPKIRIIIIKTSVTLLLVNRLSVCTRQTDYQFSVHNNITTVHRNLVNSLAALSYVELLESVKWRLFIIDAVSSGKIKLPIKTAENVINIDVLLIIFVNKYLKICSL